jgi:hypothetical protein
MDQIEITPMSVDLLESFHRAIDAVARKQKFLPILEALPSKRCGLSPPTR